MKEKNIPNKFVASHLKTRLLIVSMRGDLCNGGRNYFTKHNNNTNNMLISFRHSG